MPGKIFFNKSQIELIRKMAFEGETKVNMAKAINRNRSVVDRILKEYNIPLMPSKCNKKGKKFEWTEERITLLKEMYNSDSYNLIDIANKLGTSYKTVSAKATKLKLKKVRAREITDGDIEYFNKYYKVKTIEQMCEDRRISEFGVNKKLKLLGLKNGPVKYANRNMPENDDFWKDYINPRMSGAEIADKWNLNRTTVNKWRRQDFGKHYGNKINRYVQTSGPERQFIEILNELNLTYFFQVFIAEERVDFYLGLKLIVEINGNYWHEKEKIIKKDKQKRETLEKAGFTVLTIWEDELKDKEKIKKKIIKCYKKALNMQFV